MLDKYFKYMSQLQNRVDALIIINSEGIIEYSVVFNPELQGFVNDGYVGKHILDVYPAETEESSNHYRVMQSGEPIVNETETVTDISGKAVTFLNSTFPIEHEGDILGTIEASVIVSTGAMKSRKGAGKNLYTLDDIITDNSDMLELKEKIRKVAMGDSPVLISGDTGTGKELAAQAVHSHSNRRNGPFISLNCAAIPASILESLMFGTEKGSFTGAESKKGLFEMADKGTLFLDELNSMDLALQSKLLKAIEDKQFRKVGGETLIHVDVRIVSAMNMNPFKAVEAGNLRSDLFFRLGVVQMALPPLKERREDISVLVDYFLANFNRKMKKEIKGVNSIVQEIFHDYAWPGNVRELKNAIEHAFNLADGQFLQLKDIPEYIMLKRQKSPSASTGINFNLDRPLKDQVEDFEKELIEKVLHTSPNVTQAAKRLGLTRQTLQYKMAKYHLE